MVSMPRKMSEVIMLLRLSMVALTMPLSIVHASPSSLTVTGGLALGLATTGAAAAVRGADTARTTKIKAETTAPRGAGREVLIRSFRR